MTLKLITQSTLALILATQATNLEAGLTFAKPIPMESVVVVGNRTQVIRNNLPMTVTVVDRKTIEQSGESALLPILSRQVPGMFVSERGVTGFGVASGSAGAITMRGIGGTPTTGVLVLIDGSPQFMGIMGHHLPDSYVASDVERVEVVRGPSSILYGTNAMGGVINIITRKVAKRGISGSARLMTGSYNTQKTMINGGYRGEKLSVFGSINHDRTDGHRPNSPFAITNGYTKVGYRLNDHFQMWGDVSLAKYRTQNPGSTAAPLIDNIADIVRGVGSFTVENHHKTSDGGATFFYNWGNHQINDGYSAGQSPKNFRFHSNDNNYGVSIYQALRLMRGNTLTVGYDHKNYGGRARNEFLDGAQSVTLVDKTMSENGVYAIAQQEVAKNLTLNAGVRYERHNIFGGIVVPQAGAAFRPFSGTVIKSSISRGFRSPTIREMYMFPTANPNLLPEKISNADLSLGQSIIKNKIFVELTAFSLWGNNAIQTAAIDGKQLNQNVGTIRNRGFEASATWHATTSLDVLANYSYLWMKNPLLYAPAQHLFVSADYRLSKLSLNLSYEYVEKIYTQITPTKQSQTYNLLSARASYTISRSIMLFAKGENLTNTHYENLYQFPMPGVTLFGGVQFSFR